MTYKAQFLVQLGYNIFSGCIVRYLAKVAPSKWENLVHENIARLEEWFFSSSLSPFNMSYIWFSEVVHQRCCTSNCSFEFWLFGKSSSQQIREKGDLHGHLLVSISLTSFKDWIIHKVFCIRTACWIWVHHHLAAFTFEHRESAFASIDYYGLALWYLVTDNKTNHLTNCA